MAANELLYNIPMAAQVPPPQVTDPMDGIPIEYSYGSPGKGAHSHVHCFWLISFHSLPKC